MKQITKSGPGLCIGIPTLGRPVSLDWAFAFKNLNPPINYNAIFSCVKGKPVAEARNLIIKAALEHDCKYVLFVGDDTILPPHALRQFIFRMENDHDLGVVGGVYCSKNNPPAPLVFKENGRGSYWDWKVGDYFDVTGLGMDATLIRCEVFKDVPEPWFVTIDTDNFLDGVNHAEMWTEDLYFLEKVGKTKWKIKCDSTVLCEHEDVYTGKKYGLPVGSLPTRQPLVKKGTKKAIDVGCGPITVAFPDVESVIRVDINEDWNPDYVCDVRQLPFADKEFDLVYSSHVLEHFYASETEALLTEWTRILKLDGELWLVLPNIDWARDNFDKPDQAQHVHNVIYGGHYDEYDIHHTFFNPEKLTKILNKLGLVVIENELDGYNMFVKAKFCK